MKKAATPEQYIAATPEPKRSELQQLHALIRKTLPSLAPDTSLGMIGYGKYHYRYDSGREGDCHRVALAANKTGISVYVLAVDKGGYLAEQARAKLGRASVGKSCIRFKKLSDIDLGALTDVLRRVRGTAALGEVGGSVSPSVTVGMKRKVAPKAKSSGTKRSTTASAAKRTRSTTRKR